jgi:RimJ/RimL family protein N-acetyltransferase
MIGAMPAFLRTGRLILRRWRESDLDPFARLSGNPHVMRFFDRTRTRDECAAFIERTRQTIDNYGFGIWALELIDGDPFIGFVGFFRTSEEFSFGPAVEIGWRLAEAHWGKGYAPEAAQAALADAFSRLDTDEIIAMTAIGNLPSRRVMEKLGMGHDPAETFDHPRIPVGNPARGHVLYRLSRSEFQQRFG